MRSIEAFAAIGILSALAVPAGAQQRVPFNNNIPVAPSGIQVPPLPDAPVVYHTAEGQDIRVVIQTRGLRQPWSMAFLPDGGMLVTERGGQVRLIRNGVLDPQPVGAPANVLARGLNGLMDIALHPKFADNRYVYLTYSKPSGDNRFTLALARGVWDGKALTDIQDLFVAGEGSGESARIVFGRDGFLYMTSGGDDNTTQDPATHTARCCAYATTAARRPAIRSPQKAAQRRSTRSATATAWGSPCILRPARSGRTRTARTAATRSTCSSRAATTAGRSSAWDARIPVRGSRRGSRARA